MDMLSIPCYPCDKVLFPSNGIPQGLDDKREDTTFYNDFKIAEAFGLPSVKDTAKRAFEHWSNSIKYLVELAVVTNHLGFEWYGKNEELSKFYFSVFMKCENLAYKADAEGNNISPFTDEEVCFFHDVLD